MKRLAIVSDVHADVHALRDALVHIDRLGCDAVVCAGDIVDYGLFPEETIRLLVEREVPCIRGNHDRWAAKDGSMARTWGAAPETMAFLRGLPVSWSARIEDVRVAVHHARPGNDMAGIDPSALPPHEGREALRLADADILVVGHTHRAFRIDIGGSGTIVNPGTLLRDPADGADVVTAGTFGILELPSGDFTVHRSQDGAPASCETTRLGWFPRAAGPRLMVFLDDMREAPAGWVRVRTAKEAIALLEGGNVAQISLDHDLGEPSAGTGYDVVCWIEAAVALRGLPAPWIYIHAANAVARERMAQAVAKIRQFADGGYEPPEEKERGR